MTKKEEIAAMVARLLPVLERLSQLDDYDEVVARPGPPALASRIEGYERHLGLSLPPYYRAFLELHDGYEALAFPGKDMLSIASVMPGGAAFDDIRDWKAQSEVPDELTNAIVIANSDQPSNFDFLDAGARGDDGELVVVRWTPQGSLRFANFREYLERWCLASALEGHVGL